MSSEYKFFRKIRKIMRGRDFFVARDKVFSSHSRNFERTLTAVRFFYLCMFARSVAVVCYNWDQLFDSNFSAPLWPLQVLGWPENQTLIINMAFYMFMLGSLFAALRPEKRVFRVITFLGILYIVALNNSDGLFGNDKDMLLYPNFIFQFFPSLKNREGERSTRHLFISTFWFGQLAMCIAYAMAGYFKVTGIVSCLFDNGFAGCEVGPKIMTNMAAREFLQFGKPRFDGDLLFWFPLFGGVSYLGVIWFHVISLFFAFRFDLHRFFLGMRIVFHWGTFIFFGIGFDTTILAVIALFGMSPFKDGDITKLREFLRRIPPLGWVLR